MHNPTPAAMQASPQKVYGHTTEKLEENEHVMRSIIYQMIKARQKLPEVSIPKGYKKQVQLVGVSNYIKKDK